MTARKALFIGLLVLLALNPGVARASGSTAGTVTGVAFRDYNANGVRDALEPGQSGVAVTAYDSDGTLVGSATTAANGTYTLTVSGAHDANLRLEFSGLPSFLQSGPAGTGSGTSAQFVTLVSGAATANFGLANPDEYCQNDPDLVTSCYTYGNQITGAGKDRRQIVEVPYTATGSAFDATNSTTPTVLATNKVVGTSFGLAYDRTSQTIYVSALQKQYAGFGPGGPGGIYAISSGGAVSTLATVPNAGVDVRAAYPANVNPGPTTGDGWLTDPTWDAVGRMSLGSMVLSDDSSTLYAVNLNDRSLYPVTVATGAVGSPVAVPLATGASQGCLAADVRPFALAKNDGIFYLGEVCSAETTQVTANLRAYVYTFDPSTGTFSGSPVLEFALTYGRGAPGNGCGPGASGNWNPWQPVDNYQTGAQCAYPQPEFGSIAFDRGNMVLGFHDRFGDQSGEGFPFPVKEGVTAGDLLRACGSPGAGWTLESNGTCGGVTTAGAGNGMGPGGGDYYTADHFFATHHETNNGGVGQVPGQPVVIYTDMDPSTSNNADWRAAGLHFDNNATGINDHWFEIYDKCDSSGLSCPIGGGPTGTFGKSNGLGMVLALCNSAPIEIGNRVWLDTTAGGIQQAGQSGIKGVTVRLYNGAGTLVSTTATDGTGQYIFNAGDVIGGVLANTSYRLTFDISTVQASDLPVGVTTAALHATNANVGVDSTINSHATPDPANGNIPTVSYRTGRAGFNNHTLDAGFTTVPVGAVAPIVPVPASGTATPGAAAAGGLTIIGLFALLVGAPRLRRRTSGS